MNFSEIENSYGIAPIQKKRSKRDRLNDVFDEQDQEPMFNSSFSFPYNDDPFYQTSVLTMSQGIPLNVENTTTHNDQFASFSEYSGQMDVHNDSEYALLPKDSSMSADEKFSCDIDSIHSGYSASFCEIDKKFQLLKQMLEDLGSKQKELLLNQEFSTLDQQSNALYEIYNQCKEIIPTLQNEKKTKILRCADIHLTSCVENELEFLMKQTEMYIKEIEHLNNPNAVVDLACLIIENQPFPKSVKQNKPIKESITLKLITGALTQCTPISNVSACVIAEMSSKRKNPIIVSNNTAELKDNVAIFSNLLFPYGTRKRIIKVTFSVNVRIEHPLTNIAKCTTLETAPSNAIIVKTNENQWEESEGILLRDDVFDTDKEATWFQFANALQKRYLLATKQSLTNPIRPLTLDDFEYIRNSKFPVKIGYAPSNMPHNISPQDYDVFWHWFGPGLHKIRYQRHMCKLWVHGYICGFISRQFAETILQDCVPGTFLIRLSERIKGSFTVAYVALENQSKKICHYMISSDDVFGAKKTLPDFLGGESSLGYLIQMSFDSQGNKLFSPTIKDKVLGEFYSKRSDRGTEGYDTHLKR